MRLIDQKALRQLKRNKLAIIGIVFIISLFIIALFAPYIAPHDPYQTDFFNTLQGPSREYLLGTDDLGRDVLSRLIYGARISLTIGFISVAIGLIVGVPVGAISGFYGGKIDIITQRFVDIMMAFPGMLLAIIIVAVMGVGLVNAMIAVGIVSIPTYIRLVRGSVLSIKNKEFVQAAKAIGVRESVIIFKHILPHCLAPIIVQSSLQIGVAILWAAGLGFLGLGAQAPTPEWGAILSQGRGYIRTAHHVTTFPGIAIMLTVLGFNLLGDGLRDALDPKMRN
ncbi:nickel transporter permease [Halanaerobium hydrogeniformans]|uniref:Binding-protein-dependent transport systems inner membrane component n=1 Tax=Halanaerobium hydrogeniformans TaxID=656519 RepID=E4RII1_HALHG|nr:nickel transporter permease [Halanaerobium hydrogeniformans]ADQ15051.1 binding-protein-dependent transport systems inner membrane component [Halanaerobium hydrogeniformans]